MLYNNSTGLVNSLSDNFAVVGVGKFRVVALPTLVSVVAVYDESVAAQHLP